VRVISAASKVAKELHDTGSYVPGFPLRVLKAVVEADAILALPLVLAIHRQLCMTKRASTPLNSTVWSHAGSPSARKREVILRRLRLVPDVIALEEQRTINFRFRASKGLLWRSLPSEQGQSEPCFPNNFDKDEGIA
jgi:hypothetical protein